MRAQIIQFNQSRGNYQARTENNIALSFTIPGGEHLKLGEVLEVDLPNLIAEQRVQRVSDRKYIPVHIGTNDLHDLNYLRLMARVGHQVVSAWQVGPNPGMQATVTSGLRPPVPGPDADR